MFRGGAVHLNGTANVTIANNLFDGVGGNGIWLSDYNRGAQIMGNELRNLGENGIGLTGSTIWVDGMSNVCPIILYRTKMLNRRDQWQPASLQHHLW